jgi:3-hydroxyisobutyrate dehydrogenase
MRGDDVDNGQQIGFVGLGTMGWPMAHNLASAGFRLVVCDSVAETQKRFVDEHPGSRGVEGPEGFAEVSQVVTMLPDGKVVSTLLLDWQGGIGAQLKPGSVLLDMSSSDPTNTLELARSLERYDVRVVDAPVSGGRPRAVEGTLSIMVGGAPEDVEGVQPVLLVLRDGARQFRTGKLGTGHAMKSLNNVIAAATYCATAEALAIGMKFGLETGTVIDVVNASTGRSFVSEVVFGTGVLTGRYDSGFQLGLLAKDVGIADHLADSAELDAPTVRLVSERWQRARDRVGPVADHSQAHQGWWEADFHRHS